MADIPQVIWNPSSTLARRTTPLDTESTHKKLQRAIQPSEPSTPPQEIAVPCANNRHLAPSPFPRDDTIHFDDSLNEMSHAPSIDLCDLSFGEYAREIPEGFVADQGANAMDDSTIPRPGLEVPSSAFDGLDFSVNNYTMAHNQGSSKESASPCSVSAESLDNGQSAHQSGGVSNDNHSNTGGDRNTSTVLLGENNPAVDRIDSSVVCTVEKNQECSKGPASLRSLSSDSPDDDPTGEELNVASEDNSSSTGGSPSTSSPLLHGKDLAFDGVGPSADACTGADDLGSSKDVVLSRSLSAKSSDGGTPEVQPNLVLDNDHSNASTLDGQSIVTPSSEMAAKVTIAPEDSSPISDDRDIKKGKAIKRSREVEIPAGDVGSFPQPISIG